MTKPACPSYAGYRFPAEVISHAVWLYFRFPLSLHMVDELLAARGIIVNVIGVDSARLPGSEGAVTQDFVVANGPAFVALDAKTFLGSLKLAPSCNASTHGVL